MIICLAFRRKRRRRERAKEIIKRFRCFEKGLNDEHVLESSLGAHSLSDLLISLSSVFCEVQATIIRTIKF